MIRVIVNGEALDLASDTRITIERVNPAYLGENVDVIRGDFSYPFTLSLTPRNRRLLSQPQRLDNAERLPAGLPADIYIGPHLLLRGQLNVTESSRTTVRVYISGNPLRDLKNVPLNSLTDLGVVPVQNDAELIGHMKATTITPTAYNYVFFPVYNRNLVTPGDGTPDDAYFHNAYDFTPQVFRTDGPITPFPRVESVLATLFAGAGYTFRNGFQTEDELKRLCLVNNRTIRTSDSFTPDAPVAAHLSEMAGSDFVKAICRVFCLAPFADSTGTNIELLPLKGIANRDAARDWTTYAGREYKRENILSGIKRHAYPAEAYARFFTWLDGYPQADYYIEELPNFNAPPPQGDGYYYQYSLGRLHRFYEADGGTKSSLLIDHLGAIDNDFGEEENLPAIYPLPTEQLFFYPVLDDQLLVGVMGESVVNGSEGGAVTNFLSIFRGDANTQDGRPYPLGSYNNFEYFTNPLAGEKYSLSWEGPFGLYENWWKDWDNLLQESSPVTRAMLLPLSELIGFRFQEKVRVENRNYFVRKFTFEVSVRGVSPAKCEMVSVF